MSGARARILVVADDARAAARLQVHLRPFMRQRGEIVVAAGLRATSDVQPRAVVWLLGEAASVEKQTRGQGRLRAPAIVVRLTAASPLQVPAIPSAVVVPRNGRAVAELEEEDEAWAEVVAALHVLLDQPPREPAVSWRYWLATGLVMALALGGVGIERMLRTPNPPHAPPDLRQGIPVLLGDETKPKPVHPAVSPPGPARTGGSNVTQVQTPQPGRTPAKPARPPEKPLDKSAAEAVVTPSPIPTAAEPLRGDAQCTDGRCVLNGLDPAHVAADTRYACLRAPSTPALRGRAERCVLDLQAQPLSCRRLDAETARFPLQGAVTWQIPCPAP